MGMARTFSLRRSRLRVLAHRLALLVLCLLSFIICSIASGCRDAIVKNIRWNGGIITKRMALFPFTHLSSPTRTNPLSFVTSFAPLAFHRTATLSALVGIFNRRWQLPSLKPHAPVVADNSGGNGMAACCVGAAMFYLPAAAAAAIRCW